MKVPRKITASMTARKGYIAVKGKIQKHAFIQTLVPVKDEAYRLYVNTPMMKGAKVKPGDVALFEISEDKKQRSRKPPPMPVLLKEALRDHGLENAFKQHTPTRQKMIITYLSHLKSQESIRRNVDKLIKAMKEKDQQSWMTRK